jgi:hypothetical protein
MKKNLVKCIAGIFAATLLNTAHAELFINPVSKSNTGAWEGSAHFGTSSVEYEEDGVSGDIDRTFLGVTFAYGMNDSIDLYGTLSYTLEAEAEGFPDSDTGFILGAGIRGKIPSDMEVSLHGYAQLLLIDEDYGSETSFGSTSTLSGEETSIMLGVVASKALDNNIVVYGGLELNLMSDLDIEQKDDVFGDFSISADRDNFLGFRLGANFNPGNFLLNVNAALFHETGIFISGSKSF